MSTYLARLDMPSYDITAEQLRALFDYNSETGDFKWRASNGRRIRAGERAGSLHTNGYLTCKMSGQTYLVHRLIWMHVHGVWPDVIDHINGVRSDNRLLNLRSVNTKNNVQNRLNASKNNASGLPGAHWIPARGKWSSILYYDGKQHRLGYFETAIEASAAYLKEKRLRHPGFAG
jgi:HNH endonuclease